MYIYIYKIPNIISTFYRHFGGARAFIGQIRHSPFLDAALWYRGGKSYSVLGGKGEERGLLPRVVEGLLAESWNAGIGNLPPKKNL